MNPEPITRTDWLTLALYDACIESIGNNWIDRFADSIAVSYAESAIDDRFFERSFYNACTE